MNRKIRNLVQLLVGGLLSAIFLYFAFKEVDVPDLTQRLRNLDGGVLAGFVGVQVLVVLVRIYRWGVLVKPLGNPSARAIFRSGAIGIPAIFFLPLRLGEFARPALIQRAGVPFSGAIAAVIVERVVDGLMNVFICFALLLTLDADFPQELQWMASLALVGFGAGFLLLVALVIFESQTLAILTRVIAPVSENLAKRVSDLLARFVEGVRVLKNPKSLFAFVSATMFYWVANGLVVGWLGQHFVAGLPLFAGLFSMSVVVFAIMVPAAPGFIGTMEAGFFLGMSPFGAPREAVAAVAILFHVITGLLLAVLAGIGFAVGSGELRTSPAEGRNASPPDES